MKVSERGQITIPKELRDRYGITPATQIELIDVPEGILIVKRVAASPFRRFLGKATARDVPRRTDELLSSLRDAEGDDPAGDDPAENVSPGVGPSGDAASGPERDRQDGDPSR